MIVYFKQISRVLLLTIFILSGTLTKANFFAGGGCTSSTSDCCNQYNFNFTPNVISLETVAGVTKATLRFPKPLNIGTFPPSNSEGCTNYAITKYQWTFENDVTIISGGDILDNTTITEVEVVFPSGCSGKTTTVGLCVSLYNGTTLISCFHDQKVVIQNPLSTSNASIETSVGSCGEYSFLLKDVQGGANGQWSFGDGTYAPATVNTILHTYPSNGTYTVSYTNDAIAPCVVATTVTVTNYPEIDFSYSFPDPCDISQGLILSIGAYNSSYNYSWQVNGVNYPALGQIGHYTSGFINGINTIKLSVTDDNGCSSSVVKYVTFGNISANFSVANNGHLCSGDILTFSGVTGGANSYIWTFVDANSNVVYTSPASEYYPPQNILSTPGNYTVTLVVTSQYPDPQNPNLSVSCSDSHSEQIEIHQPLDADFTWVSSGSICGEIQLALINAPSDLTSYSIDYGDGSPVVNGIGNFNPATHHYNNGTYSVVVTLNNDGCTSTKTHLIYINTSASAYITSATQNLCPGGNLTLNAVIANANGNGGINYEWFHNGNTVGNTAQINITEGGSYSVTLTPTSSAICFSNNTATININLLGNPTATIVGSPIASNCGNADGEVVLLITDPLLETNGFLINGVPYTANPITHQVTVSNLAPGTQNLTISNILDPSCSGVVSVTIPDNSPVVTPNITSETCDGGDGQVVVNASGGSGGYITYLIYSASNYPTTHLNSNTSGIFTGLSAGQYVITVSDENGCTTIENILVPKSDVGLSLEDDNLGLCIGGSIDVAFNLTGTTASPIVYIKNGTTYDPTGNGFTISQPGDYKATVTEGSCIAELFFTVAELDPIDVYLQVINANCPGEVATVQANASAGGGGYAYTWVNAAGTADVATVTGLAGSPKNVSVTVTDGYGCASPTVDVDVVFTEPITLCQTGITQGDATITLADGSTISPDPNYASSISISNCGLNVCASGGTAPYVFDWILQDAELVETTTITFNLIGNPVTYIVTDADNQIVEITTSDKVQYIDGSPITVVLSPADQTIVLGNSNLLYPFTLPVNPVDYVIFNSDDVNLGLTGTYKYPYWKIVKESNSSVWTGNYIIVPNLQSDGITPFTVSESTTTIKDVSVMTHASIAGTAPATTPLNAEFVSGTYNLLITDANGCTVTFEDIDIELPVTPPFPEFKYVWKKVSTPPVSEPVVVDVNLQDNMQEASNSLLSAVQQCLQTQAQEMKANFETNCFDIATFRDEMTISYPIYEHHYTLYYYDRAGQLTKTVPPQGVDILTDGSNSTTDYITPIIEFRKGTSIVPQKYVPDHIMETTYQYNSLGQLISQTTPDGGTTTFIYDGKNRLRFSQNEQQLADETFSYTKYDALGRIVEVGQSEEIFSLPPDQGNETGRISNANVDNPDFPYNLNTQITRTVYSTPAGVDYYGVPQHYLQNRVSYVYNDFDGDFTTTNDQYYTYYSYDAHGNVEWLIQEDAELGKSYIAYEYDLISGNVLKVKYNEHRADRFFHKYAFDAENRLKDVYTSADNELWERDANYDYYAHGPLKRSVIGNNKVQGLDYIYTIHGWLKAINSPHLSNVDDPGSDGTKIDNDPLNEWNTNLVAEDNFGMALGYYAGDYKTDATSYLNTDYSNLYASVNKDLYNGNISHWVQSQLNSLGEKDVNQHARASIYQYDVLNRIKRSTNLDRTGANIWGQLNSSDDAYMTDYTYDGNGNLTTLNRFEGQGSQMDQLTYIYKEINGEKINQLASVTDDAADPTAYRGDLVGNHTYDYDEIGNLIHEEATELMDKNGDEVYERYDVNTSIEWTVYGKVKTVDKVVSLGGDIFSKQHIEFDYDASGNRIKKTVSRKDDNTGALNTLGAVAYNPDDVTTTYYVRDAQGNILAVYEKSGQEDNTNTYTVSLQLKEQPIYGSDRLGQKTSTLALANATGVSAGGGTVTFPPLPSGVETISEYQNWITSANKTGLLSANNKMCNCNIKELVSTGGSAYTDEGTKTEFLGVAKNGVAVAEDLNGNLQFYVVLAENYLGNNNACLVYDKFNQLIKGTELIGAVDVNSKPIVTNIAGTNQYAIVTLSANQQPIYHVVDMNAQGYSVLDPVGEVKVANIPMTNYAANGVVPTHGLHFTAFEDHINNKNVVYSTRYLPDPVLTNMGTTEVVAYELNSNNYSLTGGSSFLPSEYSLYSIPGCGNTRLGELQISPEGDQLLWYQYDKTVAGFDHRLADIYSLPLDATKTALTAAIDIISPMASGNYAGNVGKGSVEFDSNNEDVFFSQRGVYIPTGLESEKNLWKYTKANNKIDPLNPINVYLFSEIRRGVDGNLYMPNMGETYDQLHSYNGANTTTLSYSNNGFDMASSLPTQVYKMYAQGSVGTTGTTGGVPTTLLASVGNKQYELKDHLGNVRVVISDEKLLANQGDLTTIDVNDYFTPDVKSFADYYPFGSPLPTRTYQSGEYRYGFNTQEKVDEISGSGNHYTAPYWEYDPRTGRRWNLDPAGYPYQSHYSVNNNNPILFTDPLGIYGTKREARQMRREAKSAGLDPSKIYKSGDDYGFNTVEDNSIVGNFKRNYFGSEGADVQSASNLGSDPLFENPFKRITGTFTAESQITSFLLGTSDNKKYFEPSSGFSYMMKNSPGVKDALDNYLNKGKTETGYGFSPNIKSMKKFWESLPTSIEAHLDVLTNGNLARLSVGGYTAIVTPTSDENIIRIHLVNDMSMGSILLHSKWAYDNPPKTGPLSTVEMKIDLGLFDIGSLRKR